MGTLAVTTLGPCTCLYPLTCPCPYACQPLCAPVCPYVHCSRTYGLCPWGSCLSPEPGELLPDASHALGRAPGHHCVAATASLHRARCCCCVEYLRRREEGSSLLELVVGLIKESRAPQTAPGGQDVAGGDLPACHIPLLPVQKAELTRQVSTRYHRLEERPGRPGYGLLPWLGSACLP